MTTSSTEIPKACTFKIDYNRIFEKNIMTSYKVGSFIWRVYFEFLVDAHNLIKKLNIYILDHCID